MDTNFLKDSVSKSLLFGSGGEKTNFDDTQTFSKEGPLKPTSIIIRKGAIIDNITFVYGNLHIKHGGTGGTLYEAKLHENEYIVKVAGKYGYFENQKVIETLVFTTDKGRDIAPFGQILSNKDFEYNAQKGHAIYALFGIAGNFLNSIGFHTIKSSLIPETKSGLEGLFNIK